MSRFRLIPREEKFFENFIALADQLIAGARLMAEMIAGDVPDVTRPQEIKDVEHKCDFLTHEVIQLLNKTFVTPLDREDIHSLAVRLDDVMDAIDNASALIPLYRIETVRFGARELIAIVEKQAQEIRHAFEALERKTGVLEHCVEINRLENEADRVYKHAVGKLFDEEKDPLTVIKWKEVLAVLEQATDRCEDVANLLENVVVKHS